MNQILRMEDFLPKEEKEELKNRIKPIMRKKEELKKDTYFLDLEIQAKNLYKKSSFSEFLSVDQYVKYHTIEKKLELFSLKIKDSDQYKKHEEQFENKNLEELKNDLDDLKYDEITSKEAYSLALINKIEEKTK